MNFALMSTLVPSLNASISRVLVLYDIACQWHKNFQTCLTNYDAFPPLQLSTLKYWRTVVPKFHLPGHSKECQLSYNLSYTKWASRTDGERIEGGWAQTAPMATWTQESGPNARRGIFDNHWNAANRQKTLKLRKFSTFLSAMYDLTFNPGVSLDRNLQQLLAWSKSQREVAALISGSYSPAIVFKWCEMLDNLIATPLCPICTRKLKTIRLFSLYYYAQTLTQPLNLTIAELQKELLKEGKHASNSDSLSMDAQPSSISMGTFFQKAIEVEDRL